jgi:hypothetical protein
MMVHADSGMSGKRGPCQNALVTTSRPAAWIRELRLSSGQPVKVQLSPDFFVDFPVEVFTETGPGYVSAQMLGVSDQLGSDLTAWQRWFNDHTDTGSEPMELGPQSEWDEWGRQGAGLLDRLKLELGPDFDIRWHFMTEAQMRELGLQDPPRG